MYFCSKTFAYGSHFLMKFTRKAVSKEKKSSSEKTGEKKL